MQEHPLHLAERFSCLRRHRADRLPVGCPNKSNQLPSTPDLKRAQETAKKIVAACPGSKLVIDQKLTERDMGMFQGMNKHDATKTDAYKAYLSNNDRNEQLPGGGESLNQLSERCVSCLNEIAEKHMGERVVVVSHEEVIQEICRLADPTSSDRRKIPNTSITSVHMSGSDGQWTLEKVGAISHLAEDSFPEHASVMNQETNSAGGKKRGQNLKADESEETKEGSNSEEQDISATRAVRTKF
ncbi:hypothetical protein HU200_038400 [Digitaria exilis]|uniref:Uncharacterized protein n=1 Tax=Digitaria exilis TaxID=1010633 RepID=A0A835EKI9_9POAL|nr:hypothetical protein HU200_038400 [Digitaria exilis]